MKAIITDLDRTLLRTDKTLSEYTISVLKACRDAGILVMAATARPELIMLEYHEQIHFDASTVTNGARILLPDRVIEYSIPRESGRAILAKICEQPDVVISMETSDGLYANVDIPEWTPVIYDGFPKLPTDGDLYKILVSSRHESIFRAVEEALTEDTYCTVAGKSLIQIMSRQATKWNGIKTMLDAMGVPIEEAVFFGDDYDDIEAIRMCGIGAAVSNAIPDVLAVADVVVGSNDEDGVARFVRRHILHEIMACDFYQYRVE